MRKILAKKQQLIHMPYSVAICEYWQGKFWRMAHDSPIFSLPVYGKLVRNLLDMHPVIIYLSAIIHN